VPIITSLIFSGRGYLVFVVLFASLIAIEFSTELIYADDNFYQDNPWPKALGLMVSAIVIHFLDRKLSKSRGPAEYSIRDIGRPVRVFIAIFFFLMSALFWLLVIAALKTEGPLSSELSTWTAVATVASVLLGLSVYFAWRKEPDDHEPGLCQDSLFFIPMRYWPLLLPVASVFVLKFG
jgi:hypothetical protein